MSPADTGLIVVGGNVLAAVAAVLIDSKHKIDRGDSVMTGDFSGLSWFLTGQVVALSITFVVVINV